MSDALSSDTQIKGLRPALGRRQVPERFVLSGTNFIVDAEGPKSDFGTDLMFHEPIYNPENSTTLEVDDEIFVVTREAIFAYNSTANVLYPVFVFSSLLDGNFPWSAARVGLYYYFTRKGLNAVLEYNPATRAWASFTLNVPTNPHGLCEAGGRLMIVGESALANSAIDNGQDLAPSTTTGAGSQLLSLIGGGSVYGVFKTPDGCITYTSTGLMKTEVINSAVPFRHYKLAGDNVPISQFGIVAIEDEHIYLAESGFFGTNGKRPQRIQPLMSEFFHNKVFPTHDFSKPTTIRLWYNYHRQWLGVSIVDGSGNDYLYDYAYVCYLPRGEEWGMFNRQHYSIGEYWLDGVEFESYNAGYVDANGYIHKFTQTIGVEIPADGSFFQNHGSYEIPTYVSDGTYHFSTIGHFYPARHLINLPTSGVYQLQWQASYLSPDPVTAAASAAAVMTLGEDYMAYGATVLEDWLVATGNEDWMLGDDGLFSTTGAFGAGLGLYAAVEVAASYDPLGSQITVGLYRLTDQLVPDRFSLINNILVGKKTSTDYNISIVGSLDGYSQFETQAEIPSLVKSTDDMDFYACYNNGIYHWINISALLDGQSFHLKLLEVDGTLTGRI